MGTDQNTAWNLIIRNVEKEDSGVYVCQVVTEPKLSKMVYLNVVPKPVEWEEAVSSARGEWDINNPDALPNELLRGYLRDHHPDAESSGDNTTLLLHAAQLANIEGVRILGARGADVNTQSKYGLTPLASAAYDGYLEIMKILLDHPDIDLNIQNNNGFTALHFAAKFERTAAIKMLLQMPNIDLNLQTNDGDTALGWASNLKIKKLLEERDAVCSCVSAECRYYSKNAKC